MPLRDEGSAASSWPEVAERLREIAATCAEAGLGRLRVVEGDLEIEVRRDVGERRVSAPQSAPASEAAGLPLSLNGELPSAADHVLVRSDVVGIVRMSRPAVSAGALLDGERELAYVESLGVRNPVLSGGGGRIAQVLVEDGDPVEYGQPLFAIER
jgi:acetyl-CoA carboxylase biotin carboxyl carrier protein